MLLYFKFQIRSNGRIVMNLQTMLPLIYSPEKNLHFYVIKIGKTDFVFRVARRQVTLVSKAVPSYNWWSDDQFGTIINGLTASNFQGSTGLNKTAVILVSFVTFREAWVEFNGWLEYKLLTVIWLCGWSWFICPIKEFFVKVFKTVKFANSVKNQVRRI